MGLDFNPGPSAPRADGTREAEPNLLEPFYNVEGLITHIVVHGTAVNEPADDTESDEAPAAPKPKKLKHPKASKPASAPKISWAKPLATAPPKDSMQSEDLSRISKPQKVKMPLPHIIQELTVVAILCNDAIDLSSDEDLADDALEQLIKSKEEAEIFNDLPLFDVTVIHNFIDEWFDTPNISFEDLQLPIGLSVSFHGAIASELTIAQRIVELKQKIDFEKSQFKKHMAKLSVQDVKNFKIMLHELKEAFLKKPAEAQGSCERMKVLTDRCVQAYNEAEKRKALGHPGIDPRMAAKKQKKPAMAEPEAPRQEADPLVFPTSMTGPKPKARSTASELKKTRTAEAEARKRKHPEASATAPAKKKRMTKKERAAPTEP